MHRHYAGHGPPLAVTVRMVAIAFGVMKPPQPKQADEPDFEQFMQALAPGGFG